MTRKMIARAVVRLYPSKSTAITDDELVGTLLDAGDSSLVAFGGQVASMVVGALAARARWTSARPLGQLLSDAIRWAAVIIIAANLTRDVVTELHWAHKLVALNYDSILPAAVLAMFLAGVDRAGGVAGLVFVAIFAVHHPLAPLNVRLEELVQILGFGLMAIRPRREDALRGLTLLPLLAWAFFWRTEYGQHSGIGYLLPVLVALIFTAISPEVAIGTALAWATLAPYYLAMPGMTLLSVGLLSALPLAVCLAGVTRALARQSAAHS
jgi:hypothetical protein